MRTRATTTVATWLAGALLFGACASADEPAPPLDEAMRDAPSDEPVAQDDEDGAEVTGSGDAQLDQELRYGQAGGIAGRIEELRITPDGEAELTSRGREPVTFALSGEQLGDLAAALERADLASQPAEQMSDPAVPDAFTFELVQGEATVLTDEFAADDDLRPALELLRGLVDEHRPAG